ncbi:MAG: T9SS type A sorting domain-containing protein, partial [Bacteroidota bacterium]
ISACICLFLPCFASGQVDTIFKTFSLAQTENGVLIQFTMFGGATCNGIRIERSEDQVLFETVYEIVGVCGSSSIETNYSLVDLDPIRNTTSYYRLDAGLQGQYSETREITYIAYDEDGVTVFPNPCMESCSIYIDNKSNDVIQCKLINTKGIMVLFESIRTNVWSPQTKFLPQGLYFYELTKRNGAKFTGKILIGNT